VKGTGVKLMLRIDDIDENEINSGTFSSLVQENKSDALIL
jgi:hypothetical protein